MVNKSGNIGTRIETTFVRWLAPSGFPNAERRRLRGGRDEGDVISHVGLVWEVKGGKRAKEAAAGSVLMSTWLAETETERLNAGADIGVLVVQRTNRSMPGVAGWDAVVPLWAAVQLTLHKAWQPNLSVPGIAPVRFLLTDLVHLLRAAGYGDPLEPIAVAS